MGQSQILANIILNKITMPFLEASNFDNAWLTIRATTSDNYFDIARWHCDGYYYFSENSTNSYAGNFKIIATLRGPQTLIIEENNDAKKNLKEKQSEMSLERKILIENKNEIEIKKINNELYKKYRIIIDETLAKYPKLQLNNNNAIIFMAGNEERCAIHSEPKFNEDRLFISIVSGNNNDISEMARLDGYEINTPIHQ